MLRVVLAAIFAAARLTGQGLCPVLAHNDFVPPRLATLSVQVAPVHSWYGQPLTVTLTLSAGVDSVYLPNDFRNFLTSCEHGFSASLLTPQGSNADHRGRGCGRSHLASSNDTAQSELKQYVRLAPGETRTWQIILPTSQVDRGFQCLYGEYFSLGYMIDEVGRLPTVAGTMAKGRIVAAPVQVHISR